MQEPRQAILVRVPPAIKQMIQRDAAVSRRSMGRFLQVLIEAHYKSSQPFEANSCGDCGDAA
jgi:uncharacterized protein (DUF1778 family)